MAGSIPTLFIETLLVLTLSPVFSTPTRNDVSEHKPVVLHVLSYQIQIRSTAHFWLAFSKAAWHKYLDVFPTFLTTSIFPSIQYKIKLQRLTMDAKQPLSFLLHVTVTDIWHYYVVNTDAPMSKQHFTPAAGRDEASSNYFIYSQPI